MKSRIKCLLPNWYVCVAHIGGGVVIKRIPRSSCSKEEAKTRLRTEVKALKASEGVKTKVRTQYYL